jgi:predicted CopG family antitoxin
LTATLVATKIVVVKVAKKSPPPARGPSSGRATVTLSRDTYEKIDELRGTQARSAWLRQLIEREEKRRQHDRFASLLRKQYTPAVVKETLAVNEEFPIHET